MTKIYQIDDNGNMKELATYSLSPKEAIKAAYMQFVKNTHNTWDYDKLFNAEIKEGRDSYHIKYGKNSALCVRK